MKGTIGRNVAFASAEGADEPVLPVDEIGEGCVGRTVPDFVHPNQLGFDGGVVNKEGEEEREHRVTFKESSQTIKCRN